jgi:hypothetical protein
MAEWKGIIARGEIQATHIVGDFVYGLRHDDVSDKGGVMGD